MGDGPPSAAQQSFQSQAGGLDSLAGSHSECERCGESIPPLGNHHCTGMKISAIRRIIREEIHAAIAQGWIERGRHQRRPKRW